MLADGYHDVPAGKIAMVVTHLEMHAPQLRGTPCPDGLQLADLQPDLGTYRALFRRIGEDWLWFGRLVLDDAALGEVLNDPDVHLYTLLKDGRPEALLELDFRQQDHCELAYFGLSAALIGSGAGSYLLDVAQTRAFARAGRMHVHTCTLDSPQALGFYIRSGFIPYRSQVEVADDPRLTGVLPRGAKPDLPRI